MDLLKLLRDDRLLDAGVLALGLERGWVDRQTVAAFAADQLAAGDERSEVVELAACEDLEPDAIAGLLRQWGAHDMQPSVRSEQAMRQWLLAFLKSIARSDASPEEKLDRLEEIYALLGYPEEMRECSRYHVPPEDRARGLHVGDTTASPMDAMNRLIAALSREFGVSVDPPCPAA